MTLLLKKSFFKNFYGTALFLFPESCPFPPASDFYENRRLNKFCEKDIVLVFSRHNVRAVVLPEYFET